MSTDPRYAQRTARALQTLHAALALAALAWTLAALLGLDAAAQPTGAARSRTRIPALCGRAARGRGGRRAGAVRRHVVGAGRAPRRIARE